MSYTADDTLSSDPVFRGRVRMAVIKAAVAIAGEARTVRNSVDQKRNQLAVQMLQNPQAAMDRFTHSMIEASGLTSGSTDANLDSAVSSIWNYLAGITNADLA